MAKNISLLGADYPDVPAVRLPMTGGGTALFVDPDELAESVTVTARTGYTIAKNRSFKMAGIIFLVVHVSKDSGNFGTAWETIADISGYSRDASVYGIACGGGANADMRVEVYPDGKIAVQQIQSTVPTGAHINMCLGK